MTSTLRTTHPRAILLLLIFIGSLQVAAQPMSGIYSIGSGSSANFSSINAAKAALASNGVSGPVTFQIDSGSYNEQISFAAISGAGISNTITFRGDSADSSKVRIEFPSSTGLANNHVLDFQNASHIHFENLSLVRSGQNSYSRVVNLNGNCQNIHFTSCRILGANSTNTSLYQVLMYGLVNAGNRDIQINNSYLNGGSYGIFILGPGQFSRSTDIRVEHCNFENQYGGHVRLAYFASPLVIKGNESYSLLVNPSFNAIHLDNCAQDYRIEANRIKLRSGSGIRLSLSSGFSIQAALLANNIILSDSSTLSSDISGINITNSAGINIYHNSIQLPMTSNALCMSIAGIGSNNISSLNNNFIAGSGLSMWIDTATANPFSSAHHNNHYSSGPNLIQLGASTFFSNLSSYQLSSGKEAASTSILPNYLPDGIHHNTPDLDDTGTPALSSITPVTADFFGSARSLSSPDVGAVEFEHFRMGIDAIIVDTTLCNLESSSIRIRLRNFGPGPFDAALWGKISIDSIAHPSWLINLSNPLQGNDTITLLYDSAMSFNAGGVHTIRAEFGFQHNPPLYASDTLESDSIRVRAPYTGFLGNDTTICLSHALVLKSSQTFNTYSWSNGSQTSQTSISPNSLSVGTHPFTLTGEDEYCVSIDTLLLSIDPCQGIEEANSAKIKTFPNPCTDLLNIELSGFDGEYTLFIRDAGGRIIQQSRHSETIISIDTKHLRPGYHHIDVINSCAYLHCSFVKL